MKIILFLIKIYQKTISPNHGIFKEVFCFFHIGCRFYPTCSEYSLKAFSRKGFLKGGILTIKRIFKCHPFNSGGYDPLKD